MKIGIVGKGRNGKDTAAEYLRDVYGLRYHSGTSWCARHVVFAYFEQHEPGMYLSADACWFDRHSHRDLWSRVIAEYNRKVGARRFYSECLNDQDILTGVRLANEFHAVRSLCETWLFVHRPGFTDRTCEVVPIDCDHLIVNDGTVAEFQEKLDRFAASVGLFRNASTCA